MRHTQPEKLPKMQFSGVFNLKNLKILALEPILRPDSDSTLRITSEMTLSCKEVKSLENEIF